MNEAPNNKDDIVRTIRKNYDCFDGFSDKKILTHIFKTENTLSMTHAGLTIMSELYWNMELPIEKNNSLLPKHLIYLSKIMDSPYFINSKKIILFSKTHSVILTLCGKDVKEWLSRNI